MSYEIIQSLINKGNASPDDNNCQLECLQEIENVIGIMRSFIARDDPELFSEFSDRQWRKEADERLRMSNEREAIRMAKEEAERKCFSDKIKMINEEHSRNCHIQNEMNARFDITKMVELPETIANYCMTFLSTPEAPDYFERNACEILQDQSLKSGAYYAMEQKWKKVYGDDWRNVLSFKKRLWDLRPSKYFQKLTKDISIRHWNAIYLPALETSFKKMKIERIKKLSKHAEYAVFTKGMTKKHWLELLRECPMNNNPVCRKRCLEAIFISRGWSPRINADGLMVRLQCVGCNKIQSQGEIFNYACGGEQGVNMCNDCFT